MTDPERVEYELLISDGSYSHIRVKTAVNVEPGEDLLRALSRARAAVRERIRADYRGMGDLRGWITEEASP